jgi:esterase/lipase
MNLPNLSDNFENMDTLGLILQGENDEIVLEKDREFGPLISKSNIKLVTLPNSGHDISYEDFNDLQITIENFIREFSDVD